MGDYHRSKRHHGGGSQDEIWNLNKELETARNRASQVEAQLSKKNEILREMTQLQEELYENLDELQVRIDDLQNKKNSAEEARKKSRADLDRANKAYRSQKADIEAVQKNYTAQKTKNSNMKREIVNLRKQNKQMEASLEESVNRIKQQEKQDTERRNNAEEEYYLEEINHLAQTNSQLENKVSDLQLVIEGLRKQPRSHNEGSPTKASSVLVQNLGRLVADCENLQEAPEEAQIWTWTQRLVQEYFKINQERGGLAEVLSRIGKQINVDDINQVPNEFARVLNEYSELRQFAGMTRKQLGLSPSSNLQEVCERLSSL